MALAFHSTQSDRYEIIEPDSLWETPWIPELCGGFKVAPWCDTFSDIHSGIEPDGITMESGFILSAMGYPSERRVPLWVRTRLGRAGNWRVTLRWRVMTHGTVQIFVQRRQLMLWQLANEEQEYETSFLVHTGAIIPSGQTEVQDGFDLDVCLMGYDVMLSSLSVEPSDAGTLFLMGDSTVTDQTAELPYSPLTSFAGWGQALPRHIAARAVSNHAHSGLTTESFRAEGHWDVMARELRPDDLVLMQFGHNDQKIDHLKAYEGYTRNLEAFIDQIRALGARPVLVTPMARNTWREDGTYNDLLHEYAEAVRALGARMAVPVIDLHALSVAFITKTGLEPARRYFYPRDYSHTNDFGACKMASLVCGELRKRVSDLPKGFFRTGLQVHRPSKTISDKLPPPHFSSMSYEWDCFKPEAFDRPDEPITRAEAVGFVVEAAHFFGVNARCDLYPDMPEQKSLAASITAAIQNGLIPPEWTPDGLLRPNAHATPLEFAALLLRAARCRMSSWPGMPTGSDMPESAREAVEALAARGLMDDALAREPHLTRERAQEICLTLF